MIRFLQTKGRVQQFLLVGFLSIIIIMMVVTLVPTGGGLSDLFGLSLNENVLAKVGGQEITVQEVQKRAQSMAKQQLRGREVPPAIMPYFINQAQQGLVTRQMLLNEADRMGLNATEADLVYELQHGPYSDTLYPEGKFIGQDQYKALLQSSGTTVPDFERGVRDDVSIQKVLAAVTGGAVVTQSELMDEFKQQNTKVKFDYAVLSLDDVAKTVNPTDAELRAFYERMKPQLANSIPEQRKAKYILVDFAHAGTRVSDADLQSYYKQHQEEFRVPETVTVRHILIKTPPPDASGKVDQKALDAAKAKADDILKQLKAGASFESLAKKYSDDPGSKDNGGSIGQIRRGQTVPEFEQAAFGAKKGETVGPIKSSFGYHIIHIDDKTEAHLKTLDEVKPQIEPILVQQKGQAAAEQMAKQLQSAAATQGMEKAAAAKGLQVMETGFFAQGANIPGIGNSQAFQNAVFDQKPNSTPQAVSVPNGWAVVQTSEVKPVSTPTFDEAKAQLATQLKQQKAQAELARRGQELAEKAKSEHNIRAAAKAVGATVKTSEFVKPGDQVPEIGQLTGPAAMVFDMKPGDIAGPVEAGNNNEIVFSMLDKQEPTPAEFQQKKDEIQQSVLSRKKEELIQIYLTSLRDKLQKEGKIRINDKEMKKLTELSSREQ